MIVSIHTEGLTRHALWMFLQGLVVLNRNYYTRNPALPRVDASGVVYDPDGIGSHVQLYSAQQIGTYASCGTLSAAVAGWEQAHGRDARVNVHDQGNGLFHVTATIWGKGTWDPAVQMQTGNFAGLRGRRA